MKSRIVLAVVCIAVALGAGVAADEEKSAEKPKKAGPETAIATFAGGCFWCMEPPFDETEGVVATISGYTGGKIENPTYKQVSAGITGHAEALRVEYDSSRVTYERLLDVFWRNIDPTVKNRQFCDWGDQYRPEIFYHGEEQKRLAEASKKAIEESGRFNKVVVRITEAKAFYPAEEYHQDFYKKNPERYYSYRKGCGRDDRLAELWGD